MCVSSAFPALPRTASWELDMGAVGQAAGYCLLQAEKPQARNTALTKANSTAFGGSSGRKERNETILYAGCFDSTVTAFVPTYPPFTFSPRISAFSKTNRTTSSQQQRPQSTVSSDPCQEMDAWGGPKQSIQVLTELMWYQDAPHSIKVSSVSM